MKLVCTRSGELAGGTGFAPHPALALGVSTTAMTATPKLVVTVFKKFFMGFSFSPLFPDHRRHSLGVAFNAHGNTHKWATAEYQRFGMQDKLLPQRGS